MAEAKIITRVLINGVESYAGGPDVVQQVWEAGVPVVLDGLSFPWGRTSIVDQPDSSTVAFTLHQHITGDPAQVTLFEFVKAGSVVQIRSTGVASGRDVLVWAGMITTANITQVGDLELEAQVTGTDPAATIGNITVGDKPWPQEPAIDRFNRILSAAGIKTTQFVPEGGWSWQMRGTMDDSFHDVMVAFRDVDAQPPLDLLHSLAQSLGGVLWIVADETGPVVWMEDPGNRLGLQQVAVDGTTGAVSIIPLPASANGAAWSAENIDRSGIAWGQDPTQSVNVVDVAWKIPNGLNDQGNPDYLDATYEVRDTLTKVNTVQSLTVETELVDEFAASVLATHWLAEEHTGDWMISGLVIDTAVLGLDRDTIDPAGHLSMILDLLDVRLRVGYLLTLVDLPVWCPENPERSYYVEGGTYTWQAGRWILEINASPNAIGGSVTSADFADTVTVADFGSLRSRDLWGVAAPMDALTGMGGGRFGLGEFGI